MVTYMTPNDPIGLKTFYSFNQKIYLPAGLRSVYLMGAYDPDMDKFCTVTKVGNGLDTNTIHRQHRQIKMIKISKVMPIMLLIRIGYSRITLRYPVG